MLITTAEDSYNVFRPNLEADEDDEENDVNVDDQISVQHSEQISTTDQEESKTSKPLRSTPAGTNVYVDSEDEEEAEQQKFIKAAKKLNR